MASAAADAGCADKDDHHRKTKSSANLWALWPAGTQMHCGQARRQTGHGRERGAHTHGRADGPWRIEFTLRPQARRRQRRLCRAQVASARWPASTMHARTLCTHSAHTACWLAGAAGRARTHRASQLGQPSESERAFFEPGPWASQPAGRVRTSAGASR